MNRFLLVMAFFSFGSFGASINEFKVGSTTSKSVFLESSSVELSAFELFHNNKPIGMVYSLGSEPPNPIEVKILNDSLALIKYDAGAAGTSTLMQMNRVAVISKGPGKDLNWKILGDHAISLKRFQGLQTVLELDRAWNWNLKNMSLNFEPFDEEQKALYEWHKKEKLFKRK